jgi:hypothetical protein
MATRLLGRAGPALSVSWLAGATNKAQPALFQPAAPVIDYPRQACTCVLNWEHGASTTDVR